MKRITYLAMLLVAMTFMSFSCSKDDDSDTPDVLTTQDLVGNWDFVSLTFNGTVYDTEAELLALDDNYNYIQLSFKGVTTTHIGLLDHRGSGVPASDTYTLSNNQINFRNGFLVFSIENWETFDGSFLELKLLSSNLDATSKPIGGIYTLTFSAI